MPLKVDIGAPHEDVAHEMAELLAAERLIAGGMITSGASHYWWEEEMHTNHYWRVVGYTVEEHKEAITTRIEDVHPDEVPIIAFTDIDGNEKFLDWIQESVRGE